MSSPDARVWLRQSEHRLDDPADPVTTVLDKLAKPVTTGGKADRVAVDAEDALIAALKVKAERPDATITYVRRQNRRGDARHPAHSLSTNRR